MNDITKRIKWFIKKDIYEFNGLDITKPLTPLQVDTVSCKQAESEYERVLKEIENPDFGGKTGWVSYAPDWMKELWGHLSESTRLLVYVLSERGNGDYEELEECRNSCPLDDSWFTN